jgi:hypothetical protein
MISCGQIIGLILKGGTFVFVRCLDRKEIYRYFS